MESLERFIKESGYGPHLATQSGTDLVRSWAKTVGEIQSGNALDLDDYLNDMDLRQIIADALHKVPNAFDQATREALANADLKFHEATASQAACLWGQDLAEKHAWTPEANPWYFRVPEPNPWTQAR